MGCVATERLEAAHRLLRKAASDLAAARTLARDPDQADEPIGFHGHQTVEKSVKAVLRCLDVDFHPTHDIDSLLREVAQQDMPIPDLVLSARWIDDWDMTICYEEAKTILDRMQAIDLATAALAWAQEVVSTTADEPAQAAYSDTLPLPAGWDRMLDGRPMPDIVAEIRRARDSR